MTRRLRGNGITGLTGLASVSLAAAVACSGVGCSSNNNPGTDAGSAGSVDTGTGTPDANPKLSACSAVTFSPAAGAIAAGSNVVLSAAGLPKSGLIFFTTDGTFPNTTTSKVYTGRATGIQVNQSETINAIAYAAGVCNPSALASAAYMVDQAQPDAGHTTTPGTPLFAPAGGSTVNNAVTVSIGSANASTICYTLDGTAPSCTAAGGCSGGSVAYVSSSGGIAIPPASSTSTTGDYTLAAIGCASGAESAVESQNYTLQVATPTSSRASGALLYAPGLTTTISSTTVGASIYYTTDGTTPTCDGGKVVPAGGVTPVSNEALQAIACKTGFASSAVMTSNYTLTLNPPAVQTVTTPISVDPFEAAVLDTANAGAGDWICASVGTPAAVVTPACGVATNTCTSGTYTALSSGTTTVAVSTSGQQVDAIACAPPGIASSTVVTGGAYTLQLSAPAVVLHAAPNATPSSQYTVTGTNNEINIVQPGTAATPADVAAGSACYLADPPAGQVAACSATSTTACASGTYVAAGAGWTAGSGDFGPGETVSVVLCPGAVPSTGEGYLPSAPVLVSFLGAGQAGPPVVATSTAVGAPVGVPETPVLINNNPGPVTACYTIDGSAPVCNAGACTTGTAVALGGASSPSLTYTITSGGTGYTTAAAGGISGGGITGCTTSTPTVGGNGAITGLMTTGQCVGTGMTDLPTIAITDPGTLASGSGAIYAASVENDVVFNVTNPGTGYTAAPVITVAGGGGAAGPISAACPGGGATPSMGAMSVQDLTCATFSATAPTVGSVAGFGPSGSTLTATAAVTSQNPTGAATATFADSSCTGGSVSIAPAAGTCTTAGSATAAAGTGNLSAIVFPTGCTGLTSATQTFIVTGAGFVACGGSTTKVIAGRAVSETVHVTVTGAGSGYSAATNVSLSAGPTACTGGAITFELLSISPATGCEGYNAPPTVSLGGGTASATATLTPQVAFTQIAAGSGYSVSPNLPTITLSGGGGGGTCTGMGTGGVVGAGGGNATIGGGGITSISNATNCSGFNSNPTVSIAGGATATAIASNEAAIAAPIQNNGVVLKYVACNGSDIAASTGSTTFATFTLAAPTFAASPDQDSRTILNLGSTLTVSTTSTFADEFINWTTDGTAPVCASAGTGGTITGASGTIPATALTLATTSVKAIACGTNQLPSNVATSGFTSVAVAAP